MDKSLVGNGKEKENDEGEKLDKESLKEKLRIDIGILKNEVGKGMEEKGKNDGKESNIVWKEIIYKNWVMK